MTIKVEMLRCFVTVAQTGALAEAALRLGRTQSAISMTLKQFEAHLGRRLFESDRKNRLTAFGAQVLDLAQTELRQFDATIDTIEKCAAAPQGHIRIVSIPSAAAQVFPATITALSERHPGARIELRDTDTQQVIDALMRGHGDLGIVSGAPTLNGVRQAPLYTDPYGLICAPGHPLASGPVALGDVVAAPFVHNNLLGMIDNRAFQEAVSGARVSVHNTLSLISLVRTGAWVTVLPQSVVRFMSADLVFRPLAEVPELRQVSLLMRGAPAFPEVAEDIWRFLIGFDWTGAGPNARSS